ncbi:DNA-binding domain-containing protein [Palleronia caenipelagi]|uniref:DUF2063 domain-containing protein n=1 Tax=Palleronia caenipelagi TaxID=2489174 RepID=A0A547Q2L5_9RHOB|nr:DNA-binding domain-containing protein [Palleronia caenipelagi]TRD20634.1 DUF2063 domain-containing protein [Palleronia caenipelagi]
MSGQSEFTMALLDPGRPTPAIVTDGQGGAAGKRFDVYRNNVIVGLIDALETGFPVVAKLIGAENFRQMARVFARAHPPGSPLMMYYGAEMPEFLANLPQLSHLGYLPDIARLELALRESYHAADADPIDPQGLASVDPDRLCLHLAPSLRIVTSAWPIYDIWRFNSEENAPKPRAEAQDVVILRPEFDPAPHLLPSGAAAALASIGAGAPLGALDPEVDLQTLFALLLGHGAVTGFAEKETT